MQIETSDFCKKVILKNKDIDLRAWNEWFGVAICPTLQHDWSRFTWRMS